MISYRKAIREEAEMIAEYFVSALPVESFLALDSRLTIEGLTSLYADYIRAENTLYSYRNTFVAVTEDGFVAGAICGYSGDDFLELKKPITEDFEKRFGPNPYAQCNETGPGEFYLDSIGVAKEMRSQGIGRNLFEAIIKYAFEQGHKTIGLLVDTDNPKAEKLYRKIGFEEVGKKDFMGHTMKHIQIKAAD